MPVASADVAGLLNDEWSDDEAIPVYHDREVTLLYGDDKQLLGMVILNGSYIREHSDELQNCNVNSVVGADGAGTVTEPVDEVECGLEQGHCSYS